MATPNYLIPPWMNNQPGDVARVALEAQRTQASLVNESRRLQAQQQMAEMENQARVAAAEKRQLLEQQQMEIEKAYKDAQIGLQQEELKRRQEETELKAQKAAQQYQAQQMAQQEAERMIQTDPEMAKNPEGAWRLAWMKHGVAAGAPSGLMSQMMRQPATPHIPETAQLGGMNIWNPSPNRWAQIPNKGGNLRAEPIEGTDAYIQIGGRAFPKKASEESIAAGKALAAWKLKLSKKDLEMVMAPVLPEMGPLEKARIMELRAKYAELMADIKAAKGAKPGESKPPEKGQPRKAGRFTIIEDDEPDDSETNMDVEE